MLTNLTPEALDSFIKENGSQISQFAVKSFLNSGFQIDIPETKLTDNAATSAAKLLITGKCPPKFNISFKECNLTNKGAEEIANALASGKCPTDLSLNFCDTHIGSQGVTAIANALMTGNAPRGLKLDFRNYHGTEITDSGAYSIGNALKSGKCPQGLHINLAYNALENSGALYIAKALESEHCPQDLNINLCHNRISQKGAAAFAKALTSDSCPESLCIDLTLNDLGLLEASLMTAVENNTIPPGVFIKIGNDDATKARIQSLLEKNRIRHAALACITMQQGLRSPSSVVSKLNEGLLCGTVYSYLFPVQDEKRKEIFISKVTNTSPEFFQKARDERKRDNTPGFGDYWLGMFRNLGFM